MLCKMEILAGKDGFIYIQNMTTESIYKILVEEHSYHERTHLEYRAFPCTKFEEGHHVWVDEHDYVANDMYCLIEDMQEI